MLRAAAFLLAWLAFVVAVVAMAARYLPVVNHAVLITAALSPYLMLVGAGLATALMVGTRSWLAAGVAFLLVALTVLIRLPQFTGPQRAPGPTVPIRVVTANLMEGAADPDALIGIARADADVLMVQELTAELAGRLRQLDADFPYRAVDARPAASGVGIWSRYPITQSARDPGYQLGVVTASLRVPGAASEVTVMAVHLVGPWPQPIDGWRREIAALPRTLAAAARSAGNGAVVVAGDLNATADMKPFRQLLGGGFRDAAEQSGAGLLRTYPSNRSAPPLIGIDHVLTLNSWTQTMRTVRIPGSDHLGVTATILVAQ